jgi:hypothetical protein
MHQVGDILVRTRLEYDNVVIGTLGIVVSRGTQTSKVRILDGPFAGRVHTWGDSYVEPYKPPEPEWRI